MILLGHLLGWKLLLETRLLHSQSRHLTLGPLGLALEVSVPPPLF